MEARTRKEADELIAGAVELGVNLLLAGAEMSRIEDAIIRICKAGGAETVDVFAMTYFIDVTAYFKSLGYLSQSRRVYESNTDMGVLEGLNALSRNICKKEEDISLSCIRQEIINIKNKRAVSAARILAGNAMIAASFTLFFGGTYKDATVSGIIGCSLYFFDILLGKLNMNKFLSTCVCAFIAGVLAVFAQSTGLELNTDKINIGNIMILIPGLMITNSFREMFNNNITAGSVRFLEALIRSVFVAVGMGMIYLIFSI